MYRFLQENKKKLMAFFAVGLMIVFILPTTMRSAFDPQRIKLGKLRGESVRLGDVRGYEQAWHDASSLHVFNPEGAAALSRDPRLRARGVSEWEPLVPQLFAGIDPESLRRFESIHEGFFLLMREAEQSGVRPDLERARQLLAGGDAGGPMIGARLPGDSRIIGLDGPMIDEGIRDRYARALAMLLAAHEVFVRSSSTLLKVSAPLEQRELATGAQQVRLRVHEIPVRPFIDHRRVPDEATVRAHFEKYADTPAGTVTPENPLGFGYRLPDAVKVQYLLVNGGAIREAVLASRPADRWEVEARRHYLRNPSEFPATRPASTQPTPPDEFSLGPAQQPANPTTAPFESVRERAIEAVLQPEVERATRNILGRIGQRMQTDFTAWKAAIDSRKPAPPSSLGVAYDSVEYLEKLADLVQSEFKVRPAVVSLAREFLTRELADKDDRLGSLFMQSSEGGLGGFLFATTILFDLNADFHKDARGGLSRFEPSKPLRDFSGNHAIIRIADARPAQKATDLDAARSAAIADLHLADALEQARLSAEAILARVSDRSLVDAGLPRTIDTGLFPVAGVPTTLGIPYTSQAAMQRHVIALLRELASRGGTLEPPLKAVVALPAQPWQATAALSPWENLRDSIATRTPRVLLVELAEVCGDWTDEVTRERFRMQQSATIIRQLVTGQTPDEARFNGGPVVNQLSRSWFDFASIAARTGYVPAQPDRLSPPREAAAAKAN